MLVFGMEYLLFQILLEVFFTDALYKAEHYTAAYNVFYWISSIMSVLITIFGGGSRK